MDGNVLKKQQAALLQPETIPAPSRARNFSIFCQISEDNMSASVRVAAVGDDCGIEAHDIVAKLFQQGVRVGINIEKIEAIVSGKRFGEDIIVASGFYPKHGEDAALIPQVELQEFSTAATAKNFPGQRIVLGTPVEYGQAVIVKKPATSGTPGMSVRGWFIKPAPGKDIQLPEGENLAASEDGLTLTAAMPGLAGLAGGKPAIREKDYDEWKFNIQHLKNNMEAVLVITPGISKQPEMDEGAFNKLLSDSGIGFGADTLAFRRLPANIRSTTVIPVASGEPPHRGKDAEIIELFKSGAQAGAPLHQVAKGQPIVEKKTGEPGRKGRNILDEPVQPPDIADVDLKPGANTALSEDGLRIIANINGYISRDKGAYCVVDCAEFDAASGNLPKKIDHGGMVRINGDLPAGHSVIAGHHIEITGAVAGADVIAGGSLVVRGSVSDCDSCKVQSGSDMFIGSAARSRLISGGCIFIGESVRDCNLYAGGAVRPWNGRAVIAGARIVASGDVIAAAIGSMNKEPTDIAAGVPFAIRSRYEYSAAELAEFMKKYELTEKAMNSFGDKDAALDLDGANKYASLKLVHEFLSEKIRFHSENLLKLRAAIMNMSRNTRISASEAAYPGSTIRIGTASFKTVSRMDNTAFSLNKEGSAIDASRM